jgi:hypothetical protein
LRGGLLLLLLAVACHGPDAEEAARRGHLDGIWSVTTISGRNVPEGSYLVRLRAGRVTGGHDGCNSWAFDATVPPRPDGTRMIVADAQECAPTPSMRAYWRALGNGNVPPGLTGSGELRIKAAGEELLARRKPDAKSRFKTDG